MKKTLSIFLFISFFSFAQNDSKTQLDITYLLEQNINYRVGNSYINSSCVLDIYVPKKTKNYSTIVYFHGGALKQGNKYIPEYLKNKGLGVVAVNYRFYPDVSTSTVLDDTAKAVKWVYDNIEKYGGSKSLIFLSGHSAGGYISSMLGLDKSYLNKYDIDPNTLAGLIPLSGHTITHMTVREEMGIPITKPFVDKMSPLFHIGPDTPPYIMITGDRELELLGRYEENAYMQRMMLVVGNEKSELYEIEGYGHNMVYPSLPILLKRVNEISEKIKKIN
jgi:acetyl esterase/lipase